VLLISLYPLYRQKVTSVNLFSFPIAADLSRQAKKDTATRGKAREGAGLSAPPERKRIGKKEQVANLWSD